MKMKQQLKSKKFLQGATILEVMISVFLLAFGILALMIAQLHSVSSVGEAENRTLIAQAAEALAEGMQVNPTLKTTDNKTSIIGYANYKQADLKAPSATDFSALTGTDLKAVQIQNFEAALSQIPDVTEIKYAICPNETEPTIAASQCDAAKGGMESGTMIKVVWTMKATDSSRSDEHYTYMLKVRG